MIKIGDTLILDIRLGTNKVKASIGNTPVMGYPYDHKILYLKNEEIQYINTSIIPDENTGVYLKIKPNFTDDKYCLGLRDDDANTRWTIGRDYDKGWYYGYGDYYYYAYDAKYTGVVELTINYLNNKKATAYINNSYYEESLPTLSFTPQNNIRLFGTSGMVQNYALCSVEIYECKISQGNSIILDLIPVRKDGVGYMYDKVSNALFGNNGTGDFILGPDI